VVAAVAATVYHLLGVDPRLEIRDRLGRPLTLCEGRVIEKIIGT
jgi:flagellar motor switch protein FliM